MQQEQPKSSNTMPAMKAIEPEKRLSRAESHVGKSRLMELLKRLASEK